ncbi:GNAT family N-acetyltransferase [Shumkonia mesophila]|uniref:GNAT family N-acetyltransferase n=1 Tax=Shumkonia mesophila TaxID=2838854 RepID=UPI0029344275|nr:GNAT family N-acetyltransferase [Shumkonia mesophila]
MGSSDFVIRAMAPADLALAIEWAAGEGWNPGLDDAEAFLTADPGGFLIGELGGEPAGGISVVAYGQAFGFLGLYIIRPEFRGRGYGIKLWQAGMKRLAGRNVGLDGVAAQQANYRRSGFQYAYANARFEGVGGGSAPGGTIELADVPFERVSACDARHFGVPREAFLRTWIKRPGGRALGVVEEKHLRGYGVIRPCRVGHKIGPLFADTPEVAERLFTGLAASVPGDPLFLDVPRSNGAAVALAERHGMAPVFETARMYTGGDPGLPVECVYGVTTFELG